MEIKEIKNGKQWNQLLRDFEGTFLNYWEWHNLWEEVLGEKVAHFGIYKKNEILAIFNLVYKNLPFGFKFLYLPFSPLIKKELRDQIKKKILTFIIKNLLKEAKKEKVIFIKVEPFVLKDSREKEIYISTLSDYGTQASINWILPQSTLIIDLKRNENDIFLSFKPKARYNIRLAQRKGIVIKELNNERDYLIAIDLIQKTAELKKFGVFKESYFRKLFNLKSSNLEIKTLGAFFKNKIVACSLNVIFKKRATYLFGGSDYNFRSLMSPYLLKWYEIIFFKKMGLFEYDLWGIDEEKLKGVTRFKKNFDGREISYIGSFELPVKKAYYILYKLLKK